MATRDTPAPAAPTSWTWPVPPRANRYAATVTEIRDVASGDRRVTVIEGVVWPPIGGELSIAEDAAHVRRGLVTRVELQLGIDGPARIVVWASLTQEPR